MARWLEYEPSVHLVTRPIAGMIFSYNCLDGIGRKICKSFLNERQSKLNQTIDCIAILRDVVIVL